MSRPVVSEAAEELYADMDAMAAWADERLGWPLLHYCEAIARTGIQTILDMVGETDDGWPGWAILMDPDRCPAFALPYLAQFKGVTIPPSDSEAQARARIKSTDGFDRGKPSAIIAAAQLHLTGTKTVVLRERYNAALPGVDAAYRLQLLTRSSETSDEAAMRNSALAAIPGGLQSTADVRAVSGQDWQDLMDHYATWDDVIAAYATWQDVIDDPLG